MKPKPCIALAVIKHSKHSRIVENTCLLLVYSTFLSCSQMPVGFHYTQLRLLYLINKLNSIVHALPLDSPAFEFVLKSFYRSNRTLYPCLESLILTFKGLGEFLKVLQILDDISCLHTV